MESTCLPNLASGQVTHSGSLNAKAVPLVVTPSITNPSALSPTTLIPSKHTSKLPTTSATTANCSLSLALCAARYPSLTVLVTALAVAPFASPPAPVAALSMWARAASMSVQSSIVARTRPTRPRRTSWVHSARRRLWSRRSERSRLWYDVSEVGGVGPRAAGEAFRLVGGLVCGLTEGQHEPNYIMS